MQAPLEQPTLPQVCKSQQWRLTLLELREGAVALGVLPFWVSEKKWDFNSWVKGRSPPFLWAWGRQAPFFENVSREENTSTYTQFHTRTIIQIGNLEEVLVWGAGVCYWLVLMSECWEIMAQIGYKSYKRSHLLPRWKFRILKRNLSDKKFLL